MDTGITAITDIHLALIVILAVAAVAAIVWGMRLKRARTAAKERFAANQDDSRDATIREQAELGSDPLHADTPASTQSQSQSQFTGIPQSSPAAPIPVAPAPPPIADEPAAGTPPDAGHSIDEPIATTESLATNAAGDTPPDIATTAPADRPVTVLKGLGPKVAAALADRGITTVGQIAALDTIQAAALDADLGAFSGRMARDRWIEQARFLAAGDVKGFEAVFGRL